VIAVDGNVATVDFWGVRKTVLLDIVDAPVAVGDYVLNHVGFAIRRIPAEEARATLELYDQIVRESPDDLMALDVRGEVGAAPEAAK
jgi:hydrogenase expression/formation protein HypC